MARHLDNQLHKVTRNASATVDAVTALIGRGASPNCCGKYGVTALQNAASNGHLEIATLLLDAGAEHATRSDDDSTALYWAAARGHADVVTLLLAHGADPNSYRDMGQSPLIHAINEGHLAVVTVLLQHGADATHRYGDRTALGWAKISGNPAIIRAVRTTRPTHKWDGSSSQSG